MKEVESGASSPVTVFTYTLNIIIKPFFLIGLHGDIVGTVGTSHKVRGSIPGYAEI